MKIENISLGIWIPRSSVHLNEIYHFLSGNKVNIQGLDEKRLAKYREALKMKNCQFIREAGFDFVQAICGEITITVSEEGVIILYLNSGGDSKFSKEKVMVLEKFFVEKFSPALKYLFSLGAPLPKELKTAREAYPAIITLHDCSLEQLEELARRENIGIYSKSSSDAVDLWLGENVSLLNIKHDSVATESILQELVFLKEFSFQLKNCLGIHRRIWESIDSIRELKVVAYKDFPVIRENINGFLKTLYLMRARIRQMNDIIQTRKNIKKNMRMQELYALRIDRIDNLIGDVKYIEDLWEMTIDYAKNTLGLIESLSQENIQRELNALKMVTLFAAITSFFGMNIAFPWEDRWPNTLASSFAVIGIIIVVSVIFYYFVKIFVYHRKFKLR